MDWKQSCTVRKYSAVLLKTSRNQIWKLWIKTLMSALGGGGWKLLYAIASLFCETGNTLYKGVTTATKVSNTFVSSTVFSLGNCPVELKNERCMFWQSCFFPSWSLVDSQQDFLQWSSLLSSFPQQPLEPITHTAEQRCIYTITVSSRSATLFDMWFLIFTFLSKDTTINDEGGMMLYYVLYLLTSR